MASAAVIPASKDTLFMRGFSARQHTEDIREFFAREAGRNTVEFFKDDGNGQLYIALRFESKDIAKEALNRFDNTDVLGDRVTMTWYKDLRRLRTENFRRPSNRHWTPEDQYDYRDRTMYGNRRMFTPKNRWPQATNRPRHYTRSSSRSRSRSITQSPSGRSYSRSRSSSGSIDSRDRKKKHHSVSDSKKRRTSEKRKVTKNQSPTPERESSASESSAPRGRRSGKKGEGDGSADRKATRTKEKPPAEIEDEVTDGITDARSDNDFSVEPSSPQLTTKVARNVRSAVLSVDRTKVRALPKLMEPEDPMIPDIASPDVSESPAKKPEVSTPAAAAVAAPAPVAAPPAAATHPKELVKAKKLKDDRRLYEEQISDEDELAKEKSALMAKLAREERAEAEFYSFEKPRGMRPAKPAPVPPPGVGLEFYEPEEPRETRSMKKRKPEILDYDRPSELDYDEDMEPSHREEPEVRRRRVGSDIVAAQDVRLPRSGFDGPSLDSAKRRPFYNENATSVNRGALGLSQEKMSLIRDKKEEIEKAYRQDCETFATVTKLLISKDPDLEERIQSSLRENLKEIGQRCIQELRDFVDRLKAEDDL